MVTMLDCTKNSAVAEGDKFQAETFPVPDSRRRRRGSSKLPDASWNLAALASAAKREHERIGNREASVAPRYWRLGRTLNLVREKKKFAHGEWEDWLARHGIVKLRAFRARRIADAFSSAQALRGLVLEQALELAGQRKPRLGAKLARKLGRRLQNLAKSIVRTADESAALGDRRAELLCHADRLAQALDYLRHNCA